MADIDILILHCDEMKDRLEFQQKQFDKLGLKFELVNCIKVKKIGNFLNRAMKSVFLGHFKCIKKSLKSKKYVLILENDAKIIDEEAFLKSIEEAKNIENEWDMLYFHTHNLNGTKVIERNSYFNFIQHNGNAHAYIINPKKILFFLDELRKSYKFIEKSNRKNGLECVIDKIFINNIHPKIKIISTKKNLIIQERSLFGSTTGWNNWMEQLDGTTGWNNWRNPAEHD